MEDSYHEDGLCPYCWVYWELEQDCFFCVAKRDAARRERERQERDDGASGP